MAIASRRRRSKAIIAPHVVSKIKRTIGFQVISVLTGLVTSGLRVIFYVDHSAQKRLPPQYSNYFALKKVILLRASRRERLRKRVSEVAAQAHKDEGTFVYDLRLFADARSAEDVESLTPIRK